MIRTSLRTLRPLVATRGCAFSTSETLEVRVFILSHVMIIVVGKSFEPTPC